MGSTMGSYGIAGSGLDVAKRGLSVTGHNLSNVNTAGYTRQQNLQQNNFYINVGIGAQPLLVGTGVDNQTLRQIRDGFLDIAYRNEVISHGYYSTKERAITEIEAVLGEPNGNGLQGVINEFYNAWQEVAKDPSSLAARGLLKNRTIEFSDTVNQIYTQLEKKQEDLNLEISNSIDRINGISKELTYLNKQIMQYEAVGDHANDFRDQRNLLLDELSTLVQVDIQENRDKTVTVTLGGTTLVSGTTRSEIAKIKAKDVSGNTILPSGPYVYPAWEFSGLEIPIPDGALKGLLEMRGYNGVTGAKNQVDNGSLDAAKLPQNVADPQEVTEKQGIIPMIKKQLNILVNSMAEGINNAMIGLYNLNGQQVTAGNNLGLFAQKQTAYPMEAGNIQFNPNIDDLDEIAVSATGAIGDGSGAEKILGKRRETDTIFYKDLDYNDEIYKFSYDQHYQGLIAQIGTIGQEAGNEAKAQELVINQLQNEKGAVSGVSLDEEMSNMLTYQHAYNASARVFTAIDEMIDRIVNQLKR